MHDALPLPLALLIIFGSAKLLAELCERLGQPGIVGEILAGALVGPSVLGWISPNETLKALSDLGVMFLLFGVGLEVKASELLKVGGKATLVADGTGCVRPEDASRAPVGHDVRIDRVPERRGLLHRRVGEAPARAVVQRPRH